MERNMKSNILFTSLAALTVMSGANAAQYRPVKMSYGAQLRPFVGITLGMQTIDWDSQVKSDSKTLGVTLPEDFLVFGVEGGFRFGNYHEIYNGGLTLNFDMTIPDDVETTISHIKIAEISTYSISGTYDNYIRLSGDQSRRIDLVLGAGIGAINERTSWDHVGTETTFGGTPADENDWAGMFVLKAGIDFEVTKYIILSAQTRAFIPVKSQYDLDTNFIFGGAVKYVF